MRLIALSACLSVIATLSGCDSAQLNSTSPGERNAEMRPVSSQQVDVYADHIVPAAIPAQAAATEGPNQFTNPSFESGLDGWSGCDAGDISLSSDAYVGTGALQLGAGGCTYRSINVIPGETYTLSCFVKLTSNEAWTGMGMTFGDGDYRALKEAPSAEATSTNYVRLQTSEVAPAGAQFVSAWIYSDNGALVDNCLLAQVGDSNGGEQPEPQNNILSNGDFSSVEGNGRAADWATGCSGSVTADGSSLYLSNGACVDQSLKVGDIRSIASSPATYSCLIKEVDGYSDMAVFFDNNLIAERAITTQDRNTRVELTVNVPNASNGFVSLYSEGFLRVEDCKVTSQAGGNEPGGGTDPEPEPPVTDSGNGNGAVTSASNTFSREQITIRENIVYGQGVTDEGELIDLKLDIFSPPNPLGSKRPTLVLFHGGAFVLGDKSGMHDEAMAWARRGFVTTSVQYRLASSLVRDNNFRPALDAAADGQMAIRWLRANSDRYDIDTNRVSVLGVSAGGVIAMVLATNRELNQERSTANESSLPNASISTGTNLSLGIDNGEITANMPAAPMVIHHYQLDVVTFNRVSKAYDTCDFWEQAGQSCDVVESGGFGHTVSLGPNTSMSDRIFYPFLEDKMDLQTGAYPGVSP